MERTKKQVIFVIGGARSGKSSFALYEASGIKGKKAYIATAEALDEEMKERIENHKDQRGKDWDTFEEPLRIAEIIRGRGELQCAPAKSCIGRAEGNYEVIVIDCLTLWLSNIMHRNLNVDNEIDKLIESLRSAHHASRIYVVSNEVGMGIVPDNELARRFRDLAGVLNRKVAEISDAVYLTTAGIALKIK